MDFAKVRRFNSPGFYFVSFVIPILAHERLGAGGPEMGLLFSLQIAGSMLAAPISGKLSNQRHLRGPLILFGTVGRALSYLIIYAAILQEIYWLMVAGIMCLGLGAGLFWTPMEATIADAVDYKHRAQAFGYASRQDGIGSIVGSIFAFSLWTIASYQNYPLWISLLSFPIFSIANAYAGLNVSKLIRKVPIRSRDVSIPNSNTTAMYRTILANPYITKFLVRLLSLLFVESVTNALVTPFLQVYLLMHVTSDKTKLSLLYMPGTILAMLLSPELGKFADRIKPHFWLASACFVSAFSTYIIVSSRSTLAIMAAFIIQSLSGMAAQLAIAKALSEVIPSQRGSIIGLRSFVTQAGGLIGPILGGVAWNFMGDKSPFVTAIGMRIVLGTTYLVFMAGSFALLHTPNSQAEHS